MKKIIAGFLIVLAGSHTWTTQETVSYPQQRSCMICGNIERLLTVDAHQACHRSLCMLCYSDHWDMPVFRDVQTGRVYWNFQCSHCAQVVRFYSTVAAERYVSEIDSDNEDQ